MNLKLCFLLFLLPSLFAMSQVPASIESELVILNVNTLEEKVVLREKRHFEAPNWTRDGKHLLINADGKLEKIDLNGNKLGLIFPDQITRINNDHGLSFDGKTIVFSKNEEGMGSRIYTIPAKGGKAKLITPKYPSYWHGISPDGKTLVYCAERDGAWDVWAISTQGGTEIRLTDSEGLDDGPEYSYDGQWIYFNSHRTGRMQAYRMKPDGSQQEQLTFDELDNWFPHPSPDNKSAVIISYLEDQKGAHPFGKDVKLRLLDVESKTLRDLTPVFYGGQGTINVHSWSPDGDWIAFVRYYR
ncbi:WD40-like Beta Propeller Repeat [Algoriphagus ornithinivorans]|uniref:WD40-like Beta Propeller Repeat n=1 Tax=Algoriphagus ornithinivorans TaxID=226506 RepID=A0A1I5IBN7_9BACT|nr:TolB family protein [Algoriphagus ornithinivorans]SFO58015.1 WD40-like Beta Propeller Repeat [Algoriphagus ornithinivorans]